MHSLWFFFLRKRQFTWLLMVSLVGLGIYSLVLIPKESAPEVIIPMGIVTTILPGASSSDIEELITNKLENNLKNIDGLKSLTSTSRDSVSSITVEFNPNVDIDKSIQKIKDGVDVTKSELPTDASDPIVTKVDFSEQPIHVIAISADVDAVSLTELGKQLSDEFKSVSGVSKVDVSGTREKQIQILTDASSLANYSLTVSDITTALIQSNLSTPIGRILTDGVQYSIRFEGKITAIDEIKSIPIKSLNGFPVLLSDVATVNNGVAEEKSISRVSVNSSPAEKSLTLSIYKKSGFDVTKMSRGVHDKLSDLQSPNGLLADSQVLIVFDQGEQVRKDLGDLVKAGTETVVLVIICLLITIGWRESLVAALSIPLSFVVAFIGLYLSGNTINFISLFALILAVGILVDSGIVITEAIHTRLRKYNDPNEAAKASLREYAWPLIGGTMTTIAVFTPLFFLSGIVGEFISSIPFTIIFVLAASIFVALGFVPLMAIILSKKSSQNKIELWQEKYTHIIQVWYREKLISFLKHQKAQRIFLWTLFISFILVFTLPMTGLLKVVFFPAENVDYVYVNVETTQGNPITKTDLVIRQLEEILYDKDYVESFTSTVGASSGFTLGGGSDGKYGNITIALKPERKQTSLEISDDLRSAFNSIKGAKISIEEQQNGPTSGAPVSIKFLGNDLEELALVTDKAQNLLLSIKGTRDVTVSTDDNSTEYVFQIDKQKANAAGVTPAMVVQVLRSAVFGTKATTIKDKATDVDVVVKLAVNSKSATVDFSGVPEVTVDTLNNLTVTNFSGTPVLIGPLLKETLAPANSSINHEDTLRFESVSAYTTDNVTANEIVSQFKKRSEELSLPSSVTVKYTGETEDINQSFTEMFVALIVGLLLMLAILVLSFNSIRYSFYLLLAVPYSLIGVFFGLTVTGLALSFTSLLGVIALAGVIINHAIILMDSMLNHKASNSDESLIDTVADAAVSRLRPIILTTITTVVGMIPLSRISDFWGPLAFAIMFGLSFAMLLTLVLIPTLYYRNEIRERQKIHRF